MKNWLRARLWAFLNGNSANEMVANADQKISVEVDDLGGSAKNLSLNVYYATGGVVIKSYHYNRATDRTSNSLYIIREDQDLATELSRVITLESMR